MNAAPHDDLLHVYDVALHSRLLVGTAQYPSPAILGEALKASRAEVVTVSLRREAGGGRAGESFWESDQGGTCVSCRIPRAAGR